jgi:hypothetical protein
VTAHRFRSFANSHKYVLAKTNPAVAYSPAFQPDAAAIAGITKRGTKILPEFSYAV